MTSTRLTATLTAGLAFVLAALAGAAWACTQQGVISLTSPAGASASVQRVHGTGFSAQPVEIHWNEEAGEVLATTQGPSFDVDVTVPSVAKGFYYLVAVQPKADAGHGPDRAATTFQIDSSKVAGSAGGTATATAKQPDLWSGFAQGNSQISPEGNGSTVRQNAMSTPIALTAGALGLVSLTAFSLIAVTQVRKRRAVRASAGKR